MFFSWNIILLVVALMVGRGAVAAPVESLTIDEKLALALANSNGARSGSGEISSDGTNVQVEYDMVKITPIKQKGHKRPPHAGRSRNARAAIPNTNGDAYWPEGQIPYVITSVFDNTERQKIKNAMEEIEKYTCIKFVQRDNQATYLNIIKDGGCWSYVGKTSYKRQDLSLDNGCVYKEIIVHELMHAAGVQHEHQRKDRKTMVDIVWGNIDGDNEDQFNIEQNTNDYQIPYDYHSVMHYGKTAFSERGLITIRTKQSQYQDVIGRAPTMGFFDILLLTTMYECNVECDAGIQCPSIGFVNHNCACYCPVGSTDKNPPVLQCGGGGTSPCQSLDSPCSCDLAEDTRCSGLSNSVCNVQTGACECGSDFTVYHGACVDPSTITCSTLGTVDCQCALNADFACQDFAHSECDTNTGQCLCKDGYVAVEGKCVDPADLHCNTVGEMCQCSSKTLACDSLDNTICDTETDACVCLDGYYNADGMCALPSECSALNEDCQCHLQDSVACSLLENAACNMRTGACECRSGYLLQSGDKCVMDTQAVLVNDGSAISPLFNYAADDGEWVVSTGLDSDANGFLPNNRFLSASSEDPAAIIILETEELPAGIYCVSFAVDLVGSSLFITLEFGAEADGTTFVPGNTEGMFIPERVRVRMTDPDKILFEAESYGSDTWQVRLDAIRIERCGEAGGYQTTESYYYYY